MTKLTLLIQLLCLIILFIDAIESPAPKKGKGKGKKPQIKTRSSLDDSQFKAGAKIGFTCKRVQKPLFRSPKKPKFIQFQSVTIIRYTKISISGQIMFTLVCKRDTSTDSGDVVPPEEAEQAAGGASDAGAEEGGGDAGGAEEGGGDAGGGDAGGGDAGGGDAGGGDAGGGDGADQDTTTGAPGVAPLSLSLQSFSALDSIGSGGDYSDGEPILHLEGSARYSEDERNSFSDPSQGNYLGKDRPSSHVGGRGRYGWGSNLYSEWDSSRYSIGGW